MREAVREAFLAACDGYSPDVVIADPTDSSMKKATILRGKRVE